MRVWRRKKKKSSLQSDDLFVRRHSRCWRLVHQHLLRPGIDQFSEEADGSKSLGKKVSDESSLFVQGNRNVKRRGTAKSSGPLRRHTSGNSGRKAADWSGGDEWLHLESRAEPHLWCFSLSAVAPRNKTSLWVTIEAGMNGFRRVPACGNHRPWKKHPESCANMRADCKLVLRD